MTRKSRLLPKTLLSCVLLLVVVIGHGCATTQDREFKRRFVDAEREAKARRKAWASAKEQNTFSAYADYLAKYPGSDSAARAMSKMMGRLAITEEPLFRVEQQDGYTHCIVSSDGKRLAFEQYMRSQGQGLDYSNYTRKVRVVNDGVSGEWFDRVDMGAGFSPDSRHLAYVAVNGDESWIVVDGKRIFSGKNLGTPHYSSSGSKLVFTMTEPDSGGSGKGKNSFVVCGLNGEGEMHSLRGVVDIRSIGFSQNKDRLWYVAELEDSPSSQCVVVDGRVGKQYRSIIGGPLFYPDGQHFVYLAEYEAGKVLVVDEIEAWTSGEYWWHVEDGSFALAKDGVRWQEETTSTENVTREKGNFGPQYMGQLGSFSPRPPSDAFQNPSNYRVYETRPEEVEEARAVKIDLSTAIQKLDPYRSASWDPAEEADFVTNAGFNLALRGICVQIEKQTIYEYDELACGKRIDSSDSFSFICRKNRDVHRVRVQAR